MRKGIGPSSARKVLFRRTRRYSQEVFETYYSALLGEVTSNSFEKVKVGGKDAIEYNYSLSVNGVEMEQTAFPKRCVVSFGKGFSLRWAEDPRRFAYAAL